MSKGDDFLDRVVHYIRQGLTVDKAFEMAETEERHGRYNSDAKSVHSQAESEG